ncbi:DUF3106 domain-containing protein [Edaphobacter dinghuensis]|uniref:LTXXQ motif family protein n=2 Tax=Edaphobacter dinghuensis TaxID=1560005 RepID=A0A917HMT2_9BACT|nr:DUF3106 domain-containing protein [Edaphobacter dinghuensis]GGG83586.1 hypothetical protein GCM10011585_29120 [Edaphobacter dinghuensis]
MLFHQSINAATLRPMLLSAKFRRVLQSALAVLVLASCSAAFAGPPGGGRRGFGGGGGQREMRAFPNQGQRGQNQEHLEQWMNRHSNMPLAQQQRALENEPGFRQLPPQTQQHLRDRLTQLNGMPPDQRRRMIEHNEAIERLSPPQRQQVRGAMQQLGALPMDRRRMVARAFRDLREMPPAQRQATLNSDRFRGQFSDQERGTLQQLLDVEPLLPPPPPR